ncbi:MAG: carboxypeptidase-like regulatory domain-containing protein [Bryobacteraceae bacterium]
MLLRNRVAACALVLTLSSLDARAQVLYGSLTGNVTDSTGAAVPAAKVDAVNINTGVSRQTATDDRGAYQFNDLQTGVYKITISAPAFGSVTRDAVDIGGNTVRRFDAQLQVAQLAESITVAAAGAVLQTDRADVNNSISKTQITNLPFAGNQGRNFQNLYKLVPGFTPPRELHSDAGNPQRALGTNVNGASYSNNNTRIDGATVSYPWLPHIVAYVPPAEAIETVNLVSNSFDAEQGMAGGSAVNVTIKSGTNEFHGSGHWFHTNSATAARGFFFVGSNLPKNLLNQFGGTFGGPIKKNKLFFFANLERTTRRRYASAFRTVPESPLRQGDFSGVGASIFDPLTGAADGSNRELFPNARVPVSRIDPAAAKMIALIPQPNLATFPNNYFATGTYVFNRTNADFKVNYNPTDKSSMFVRYSISPSDIFDPPSLEAAGGDALTGGQPGNSPGRTQNASIGGTYAVSARVLVDGNIGFTRQRLGSQNVDIGKNYGLDDLQIPGTNGSDFLGSGRISAFCHLRFLLGRESQPVQPLPGSGRDNQYVRCTSAARPARHHNPPLHKHTLPHRSIDFSSLWLYLAVKTMTDS